MTTVSMWECAICHRPNGEPHADTCGYAGKTVVGRPKPAKVAE